MHINHPKRSDDRRGGVGAAPKPDATPGRERGAGAFPVFCHAVTAAAGLVAAVSSTAATPRGLATPAQLKSMSVEELLSQDVISVARQAEPWQLSPSSVFLMTNRSAEISGARSLPEILRLAPNLFVAQSSAYHWAVNTRGFVRTNAYSNKLLVLVDGRTVYSPLFSNVFWDSTDVFMPDLDTIEVLSGPNGSAWGSNAVNGIINIRTKSAHETLGGLLEATVGTDADQVNVRYGTRFGSNGAVRVYAKRTVADSTLSPAGVDDNADKWEATQGGFRADWGTGDTGDFTLQGDYFTGDFSNVPPLARSDVENGNMILRWQRELADGSTFWIRTYYDYARRNTASLITETTRTSDIEFQRVQQFGRSQTLLWGGNFRYMSDSIEKTVGFIILPEALDFNLGSVFVQHEGSLTRHVRLISGVRAEHNHFSGWEIQPSVRLAWNNQDVTLWAAASRASRIPSRLDTGFYFPPAPPYLVTGGPNFISEIVNAYELGSRSRIGRNVAVTATVYLHDYDQLRSTELTTPIVVANGGEGRSYGAELFVDWDVAPWWRLRMGGFRNVQSTWLKPWSSDSEHGNGEDSFPDYEAQLRNSFRLPHGIDLWLSLRRVAEIPAFDSGNGVVPAYTELDARLSWRPTQKLELSISGRNLLDSSHPEIGGALARREIERSVRASVRWEF